MKKITLGLIGYGTVGQGVAKWLASSAKQFKTIYGVDFRLTHVCSRTFEGKNLDPIKSAKLTHNISDITTSPDIDTVIELIGGQTTAKSLVESSIKNGKHVVTANKDLIANYGSKLFQLAEKHQKHVLYESAVGAGIPTIKTISEGTIGNRCLEIYGIINGTCNYILDQMTREKTTFKKAVKQAQTLGYAESDPTLDTNGKDSTHKLAILIQQGFGTALPVKKIHTEGIDHISDVDIEYARSMNLSIKLLAIAKRHKSSIEARVHPTLISNDHPLAAVYGIHNAVYYKFDRLGPVMLSGEGAGQMAAASGVISDLINLYTRRNSNEPYLCNRQPFMPETPLKLMAEIESKYYLRFEAIDKPGVLGKITSKLGEHQISINSVNQRVHPHSSTHVPIVMLTDAASEANITEALRQLQKFTVISGQPVAIRMENLS